MLSFFILLFLIIVSATVFIVLYNNSKKAGREAVSEISDLETTPVPTLTVTPAITPTGTPDSAAASEVITELYPAYQTADGETKYGYINKSGEFVIAPVFTYASGFHDGAAVAVLGEQYCVINEGGSVIYLGDGRIEDFSNGAAVFASGNDPVSYGYIDTKGKIIIDARFTMATNFGEDGTAYVCTGSGEYALIDKAGKVLESYTLDTKYDNPRSLQDGYLVYSNSKDTKYGVINIKGEEILEQKYSEIRYLGNGLFAVKEPGLTSYEDKMMAKEAIFDQKGEQLTDFSFYDFSPYYDGYCSATDDTTTFFVGLDGKEVDNLPIFEGRGILKLFGDVVSAFIDGKQLYSSTDKFIIWQPDNTHSLSDNITVRELIFKPNRYILVRYPELDGLYDESIQEQINRQLESLFTDSRKDPSIASMLSVDDSFSAKLMNNLLIVEKDGYDYPIGAAHGMPVMNFYYFDIRTGVMYQLKDLFKAESDYITKLNELIVHEINARIAAGDSMLFSEDFPGISDNQYFKLEEDAISIYFYPYDIAAYAAGFQEFLIPFADIADYIDTGGMFWNSFRPVN